MHLSLRYSIRDNCWEAITSKHWRCQTIKLLKMKKTRADDTCPSRKVQHREEYFLVVTSVKEFNGKYYIQIHRYNMGITHSSDYQYTINIINLENLLYTETKLYYLLIILWCSGSDELVHMDIWLTYKRKLRSRAQRSSKTTLRKGQQG